MALEKMQIEIDEALINEVVRKFHLHGAREAVNLALRNLLGEPVASDTPLGDEEFDEFSNLDALRPHRRSESA
jgi:Arc/MetJ family transcription regulator